MTQEQLDHALDIRKKAYNARVCALNYREYIASFKEGLTAYNTNGMAKFPALNSIYQIDDAEAFDRLKVVISHAAIDMLKILADEKESEAKEFDNEFKKL